MIRIATKENSHSPQALTGASLLLDAAQCGHHPHVTTGVADIGREGDDEPPIVKFVVHIGGCECPGEPGYVSRR
jgi:hypothetical protein